MHFIGLINVFDFQPGFKSAGLAQLGDEQLEWMEKDVAPLCGSTPIVVLAHLPLWTVYEKWGWGTADSGRALGYLKRFGSVTVLNGHIHQIMQKVEGNLTFHTAISTAFPQPAPGAAPAPGPMLVPPEQLPKQLGLRTVNYVPGKQHPGPDRNPARGLGSRSDDRPLFVAAACRRRCGASAADPATRAAAPATVVIDGYEYNPSALTIAPGTTVTWVNEDNSPHTVTEKGKCSVRRRWIPATGFPTPSRSRASSPITARCIR